MTTNVATQFVLHAIQEWGQPEGDRIAAVQAVLDAADFRATARAAPVFGGLWPSQLPCVGPDAAAAQSWLLEMTRTSPRGKFETEVDHVAKAIADRRAVSEREADQ